MLPLEVSVADQPLHAFFFGVSLRLTFCLTPFLEHLHVIVPRKSRNMPRCRFEYSSVCVGHFERQLSVLVELPLVEDLTDIEPSLKTYPCTPIVEGGLVEDSGSDTILVV